MEFWVEYLISLKPPPPLLPLLPSCSNLFCCRCCLLKTGAQRTAVTLYMTEVFNKACFEASTPCRHMPQLFSGIAKQLEVLVA